MRTPQAPDPSLLQAKEVVEVVRFVPAFSKRRTLAAVKTLTPVSLSRAAYARRNARW
ncbi:MAG: hypothetical protein V7L25_31335 [Nostoc sp.]|uniref:hypothetical protein n=1 Tax=Nostoc sp. TaxID=1180 RepID=UPI002FEEEB50